MALFNFFVNKKTKIFYIFLINFPLEKKLITGQNIQGEGEK
jgi:hypothetical protein